ncbi:lipocalin family protein [Akkermansiaceae bacterium]|nr:lipocalin family protein [Akkermansiaceae bacterium]
MKPTAAAVLASLVFQLASCSGTGSRPPATVSSLDKARYAGEWHEIARLPNFFEKGLVAAKASYGVNDDGSISVHNQGLRSDGKLTSIKGTARPADPSAPGKLLVRFDAFPANLFEGDYWILDINPGYTRALVGSPDYRFLWILDRNPMDKGDYQPQIRKAEQLGYNTGELIFNPKRIPD